MSLKIKQLLSEIESCDSQTERKKIIYDIVEREGEDGARTLIDLYYWSPWRETKLELTRALGPTKSSRAFEHLVGLASQNRDLQLASEAILALGESELPEAGLFLINQLASLDRPLIKEIIIALGRVPFLAVEVRLVELLKSLPKREFTGLKQYLLLSLGKRQSRLAREVLLEILSEAVKYDDSLLLNSGLLCAARLGDETTLSFLRQLDTRYRLFADHLKNDAISSIESRLQLTLEDVLSQVLSESDPVKKWEISILFQSFDPEEIKEVSDTFADDLDDLDAAVISLHLPPDETQIELAVHGDIPEGLSHGIFQRFSKNKAAVTKILEELLEHKKYNLLSNLDFLESADFLGKAVSDKKYQGDLPLLINALVSQAIMKPHQLRDSVGKNLLRLMAIKSGDEKARIMRALSQIGYSEGGFLDQLRAAIIKDEGLRSSAYYALDHLQTASAEKIILDRLEQIGNGESQKEISQAIGALGEGDGSPVTLPKGIIGADDEILRLMSKRTVEGYDHIPLKALALDDFAGKLLALASGRHNPSSGLSREAQKYINDENPSLKWRAIDTLCLGDFAGHEFLLHSMRPAANPSQDFLKKIALSLRPDPKGDYRGFARKLSEWLYQNKGAYRQGPVREGLQALMDNLLLIKNPTVVEGKRAAISNAVIDDGLRKEIPRYDELSETVKTVIRNAELMHHHPELFDDAVDKSPAIVQYTKSLDILLQEKVGNALFLRSGRELLARMQSRVAELDLDDPSHPAEHLIKLIGCERTLSADNFAWSKFTTLLGEIRSGRIMKLQYRAIDGLRAWAILLMVFGREFFSKGQKHASIFSFQNPASDKVERISVTMNELQDLRNMAAHRGTVVESGEITKIRTTAIGLINELLMVIG